MACSRMLFPLTASLHVSDLCFLPCLFLERSHLCLSIPPTAYGSAPYIQRRHTYLAQQILSPATRQATFQCHKSQRRARHNRHQPTSQHQHQHGNTHCRHTQDSTKFMRSHRAGTPETPTASYPFSSESLNENNYASCFFIKFTDNNKGCLPRTSSFRAPFCACFLPCLTLSSCGTCYTESPHLFQPTEFIVFFLQLNPVHRFKFELPSMPYFIKTKGTYSPKPLLCSRNLGEPHTLLFQLHVMASASRLG